MIDYLDCNATTPLDPAVRAAMLRALDSVYGNAASSHELGRQAKRLVQLARDQVGALVAARRHEVIFTSGATESNNLALLGLEPHARQVGRLHIVSTQIEHSSVLEPLAELGRRGLEITLVAPGGDGRIDPQRVAAALRPETLLVSVMHVNHETGVVQPLAELAEMLAGRDVLFHVDAAQGFGKELELLRHGRIDLISLSAHKIYGPKGVGALIARRRSGALPPLRPLLLGGGQELGLRPGTLPVPLIAALGQAAAEAEALAVQRAARCGEIRTRLLTALAPLRPVIHGDSRHALPHVLSVSLPGVHGDDAIDALAEVAAVSNGSACASLCGTPSPVLTAMGVPPAEVAGALRLSWHHGTELRNLERMVAILRGLQAANSTAPPA